MQLHEVVLQSLLKKQCAGCSVFVLAAVKVSLHQLLERIASIHSVSRWSLRTGRTRNSLFRLLLFVFPFSKSTAQVCRADHVGLPIIQQANCAESLQMLLLIFLMRLSVGLWPSGSTRFQGALAGLP